MGHWKIDRARLALYKDDAPYAAGTLTPQPELLVPSKRDGSIAHLQNWLDAIRGTAKLNAEIEEGYKSTLMCHLGNIAWRTGRTIDPAAPKPKDVEALWSREYRAGREPKV